MNSKVILILCLLCLSVKGYAQTDKLFTADKELSNSLVNKVYQDQRGIIWIATEDGLNRYDGSKFTIYKHDYQEKNSLFDNYVHTLFEDSKGLFYIGLFSGLQTYDYATDTFTHIPLFHENREIMGAHVTTIIERRNGDILVGTSGHGVFRMEFDGDELKAVRLPFPDLILVNVLYEDRQGNLWIANDNKHLSCLRSNNHWRHYFENDGTVYNISSFCEDKEGNLYIGSNSKGVFLYREESDAVVSVTYPPYPELPVKALYVNKEGKIYIGTDGYGIKVYDPIEKTMGEGNFNITTFDFSKSKVHSIMEDRSGNIWLGIFQKGVMMLPNQMSKFNYIGYKSVSNNIIGSNCVMSICIDHAGNLWVGTDNDGIYIIDPQGKQKAHFAPSLSPTSVPSTVLSIYEDSDHTIWVGSYRSGMAKIDPETGSCEYVNLVDENFNRVERVYDITEDQNRTLWIATMGAGLYAMDLNTSKLTHYPQVEGEQYRMESNVLHNAWINCVLATRNGKIYLGTHDGISCLDVASNDFASTYGINRLFQGYIVYSLYEDAAGNIWGGTSYGLIFIDGKTRQMYTYNTANGLPSDVVCAVKEDRNHRLWISTNHGISRLDPGTQTYINYYSGDGLQGNEFSKGAAWVNGDGELMFGGLSGITWFDPDDITSQTRQMEIRITGFYIHDQPVKKGMKSGSYDIIDTSVMDARRFHLAHKDNSFTIELATMDFNNPEHITYMYSINSDNWISLSPGTNRIAFNNLAPGTYHFRIRANDYNATSEEKEVIIEIFPAWYASAWARIIYYLLALGLIYLLVQQVRHRYEARQRAQEHLHAEQINEAKLQFFINISHEIRTPMSLIISPLDKLMATDKDNERQKSYSVIRRNAERILQLINQLMDVRKIDKGQMVLEFQETDLVKVVQETCKIFDFQAKTKGIELSCHCSADAINAWIDIKNFDKIIINVLSNALKFTPQGGSVELSLNNVRVEEQEYAEIIISDSGVGVVESEMERIFDRFYQIRNSQNQSNMGTGIGLHLTRSLVELHHGTIRVRNNPEGKGCSFIIRLPLGKDHLSEEEIREKPVLPPQTTFPPVYLETDTFTDEEKKNKSKSKWKVLIVEDDDEIRKYISRELSGEYHIVESANGREALTIILENTPDLVISDIMMPEMDGITLCRKIKQNVNINHIPIILLTAKSGEEDNLEGLSMGADAYLTKPFSLEIVKKTIENIIKNREILRNTFNGNQNQSENIQEIKMKSPDERLLEKVMNLINENLNNPELSVEMIAAGVGISRVHLHRKLKALTNQSTRDLIRNIRLQHAAALLSSGKLVDTAEVAYATGFSHLSYFSNAFKELYGMAPKAYMEKYMEKGTPVK